jgi:hypothetical protein
MLSVAQALQNFNIRNLRTRARYLAPVSYTECPRGKGSSSGRSQLSVILSQKSVYVHVFYSERFPRWSYFTVQRSNTPRPHASCEVHWCWGWNFRKCFILGKLYKLCHLNNKYWYYNKQYVISLSYQQFWNCTLDEVVVFYFCCDNRSPYGRDVQAGLTDWMVYQRHVGWFLVFPVCGVRPNL